MSRLLRFPFVLLPLLVAATTAACGDDSTPPPTAPTPTTITETFTDTINVNGGRTHPFTVNQTGAVTATLSTLSPDDRTIGLGLGTWNGAACQIIIANTSAKLTSPLTSVVGNASTGQFCVWVFDSGQLAGSAEYTISVTHY